MFSHQTLVAVLTFAPRRINSVTTGTCPSFDAKCNAFKPFALQVLISKLPFKYSRTFSKFPARAARKKLATPSVYFEINKKKKFVLFFHYHFSSELPDDDEHDVHHWQIVLLMMVVVVVVEFEFR